MNPSSTLDPSAAQSLPQYSLHPRTDCDRSRRVKGHRLVCYSKKALERRHPDGGYTILGELGGSDKSESVGRCRVGRSLLNVAPDGTRNRVLFREVGFLAVGEGEYIRLLAPMLPILIPATTVAAGGAAAAIAVAGRGPVVLIPDHPLPDPDPYVSVLPGDDSEKAVSQAGGGSVSMIYTTEAEASLATGAVKIYFKNPNASNHDVALELCIVSGGREVAVAASGLVEPGYGLYRLTLDPDAARLSPGIYNGKYRVAYYDPVTGERALVHADIADVTVTVTE